MNVPTGFVLGEFIFRSPSLLILAACILYVVRRKTWEGFLALAGQFGSQVLSLVALITTHMAMNDKLPTSVLYYWRVWLRLAGLICAAMFATGFIFMVIRMARKAQPAAGRWTLSAVT